MYSGIIFKINEFAVHDGPGIRTTVFLKGCPLGCSWCHNPEGISALPQILQGPRKRLIGKKYSSRQLADLLLEHEKFLVQNNGGITFSGGEPLFQPDFLNEVIDILKPRLHIALDTCGYAESKVFENICKKVNLLLFDLKLMDNELHKKYTGKSNDLIRQNLKIALKMDKDIIIRVPLIPGVTDAKENLSEIADFLVGLNKPVQVELLPYNTAAGAKYGLVGKKFQPGFDETAAVRPNLDIFQKKNIKAIVR